MKWNYLFLFLLIGSACLAAEPYIPRIADPVLEPWRWREMTELSDLTVVCVNEASDGTFWFGNRGSIAHYDGINVRVIPFSAELITSIQPSQPATRAILETREGHLLMVVGRSLVHYVAGEWSILLSDVGLGSYQVNLEQGDGGAIWLMTRNGLWHLSADLQTIKKVVRASSRESLSAFCQDDQGDVWVVRVEKSKTGALLHIPVEMGRPVAQSAWKIHRLSVDKPNEGAALAAGRDGRIWYVDRALNNGILAFDPRDESWSEQEHPLPRNGYTSLMCDRDGTLWAGGVGILFAIRAEPRCYLPNELNLPRVSLNVYETSGGRWWVFGDGGHVYLVDHSARRWMTYEGLHFQCESSAGVQWFLTEKDRVVSFNPTEKLWLEYDQKDGLLDDPRSLTISSHGLVWLAGGHEDAAAISVFDGERWERHSHPEFARLTGRQPAFEAMDGTMWLGAHKGVSNKSSKSVGALQFCVTADGEVRILKHHAPPLFPPLIRCFAQTPDGLLWVGAPNVHCFDQALNKVWSVDALPVSGTDNLVLDANQTLWAIKAGYGVFERTEKGWKHHARADGLASEMVVDLLALKDGTLLAATDKGVSRFDGQVWMRQAFSDAFSMSPVSGNLRQSKDGSIWFNFTKNDNRSPLVQLNDQERFCTVRYVADRAPPETFIEIFLNEVDSSGNIQIAWSGRDFLADTAADDLQFSWRLNGGEWSPFADEKGRTFLGLESGAYSLEVRARDRNFNMDPAPAKVGFTVALPVWRRLWFVALVLLVVGGAAAFIGMLIYFHDKRLKDRAQHLEEIDQMKTGFFTNISHELNTPLTSILVPLERMVENTSDEVQKKMLNLVLRNAHRVANLVGQLLDFRKLEQEKISLDVIEGDLVDHARSAIELLLSISQTHQITCQVVGADACFGWFDPDKLQKIVQNLVSNAIKYSRPGGDVRVLLNKVEDETGRAQFAITVEDSGAGIKPEHLDHIFERFYRVSEKSMVAGSGIGLNLTKELVELWGGTIRAESPVHPNAECPGTRFSVVLAIELDALLEKGARYDQKE